MNKNVKYIVIGATVLALIYVLLPNKGKSKPIPTPAPPVDPDLKKNFNFDRIPDGKNNYRSAQLTPKELERVIKQYGIKNVIRMNGDGADARYKSNPPTTMAMERSICEKLGCKYQFINSHIGYVRNKGYVGSLNKVMPILKEGNTLIHCRHGADRTGAMVGGYLKQTGLITDLERLWDYTTQYNSWEFYISKNKFYGTGFDKYADTFYPIDQLKKDKR